MLTIESVSDIPSCRKLWERHIVPRHITDLWEVRDCFHRHFQRAPFFVTATEDGQVVGLIPLSHIPEKNYYGYFPGEVWQGKTWIEQNHLVTRDQDVLGQMLNWLADKKISFCLRYLSENPHFVPHLTVEDEIGYLFHPKVFDYQLPRYHALFSRKSIKAIFKEVEVMRAKNLVVREDFDEDFDAMVRFNLERFGDLSYFADERFRKSFLDLRDWLRGKGWLKLTSIFIEGEIAAVDMGCVYKGVYTLLAGGTSDRFRGIAKVINLHHIDQSCRHRYETVDFLCGDFTWKKIFHLTPRPLYMLSNLKKEGLNPVC